MKKYQLQELAGKWRDIGSPDANRSKIENLQAERLAMGYKYETRIIILRTVQNGNHQNP